MEKEKQNDKDVYHASFDCWQQYFGYTDFYDWAFDIGTSMETRHAPFSYKGKECAIKVWKGDYLNLGAGAEIGIYSKGGLQWKVEKSLAMRMSMTLRLDGNIIADYSAKHWWLTSFVPDYKNVDASSLSVSYVVFFDDTAMYNDFKDKNPAWVCDDMNQSASFSFQW